MKLFTITTLFLSFLLFHGSADAQGNCPGNKIKVFKGASGCTCKCMKECVTPEELPDYLANGWNTTGCWNCCAFKNWVEARIPKTKIEEIHPNAEPGSYTISFTLASKGNVKIRVTDTAGRFVATVLDSYREEDANELIWHHNELDPGLYYLTLETVDQRDTKMISVAN